MMKELIGEWPQVVKFICLALTVLMAASSAAALMFNSAWIAVASAVVSAWALSVCLDVWRAEIVRDLRMGQRESADEEVDPDATPDRPVDSERPMR